MKATPIFNPGQAGRPMRVAAFMSGSGSNIRRLLEHEKRLREKEGSSPFEVVFIFSDRSDGRSAGERIALENALPYVSFDIRAFHLARGVRRTVHTAEGLAARREYDQSAGRLVRAFGTDVIALGGYMSFITLEGCVNVHPADLSILDAGGRRKYVGEHAVRDAILGGESSLRSSTLWTDQGEDSGPLLMVSPPLTVELPVPLEVLSRDAKALEEVASRHQERLKEMGDWKIFPRTIELIARGAFALDPEGHVYMEGRPVPDGYRE